MMKHTNLFSSLLRKGRRVKGAMAIGCCCWALLVGLLFVACTDDEPVKKNPFLSTSTRAMLKEVVKVKFLNVDNSATITVDFGDGTIEEGKASETITHAYLESGDYTMHITAGQYAISKRIRIYDLLALSQAMKQFRDPNYNKVWVMTHRAHTTDRTIPENSVSSVLAAIESGAEIAECDTQLTKDGEVVVCHDKTINATTNGTGDITQMTLEEIHKFNLLDRSGNVTNEKMPTLKEFLKAGRGKIYFNLDYSPRTASTEQVMTIVRDLDMMEQVFFYCNSETKVREVLAFDSNAHAYCWVGSQKPMVGLPGTYFIQGSYLTNGTSTNVAAGVRDGMIVSINMLEASGSKVSQYSLNETYLDELLQIYPTVGMIQTDVPDLMIPALAKRGRR